MALLLKGEAQSALAEIEQETDESSKRMACRWPTMRWGARHSGAALAALIAKYEKEASCNIAYVYAFRGEADNAFAGLDKPVDSGDTGLPTIVTNNRQDPRRPALAAVPAQDRQGAGATGQDRVKVTLPQ